MKKNAQYYTLQYFIRQIIVTSHKNNSPSAPTRKSNKNQVSGIIKGEQQ